MAQKQDMAAIRERLQAAMDARGIKAKRLSIDAGLGETAVRDILSPESTDVRVGTLRKLATVLEWPVDDLVAGGVEKSGKIGAGGRIVFDELDEPELVERPPDAPGRLLALEVQGDSMFPVYRDRDVVYVRREHDGVLPHYLGEECAVHTADGGTWLKILAPGTQPGRYTLRSHNADDIANQEVIWASPVSFVRRRPPRFSPK